MQEEDQGLDLIALKLPNHQLINIILKAVKSSDYSQLK